MHFGYSLLKYPLPELIFVLLHSKYIPKECDGINKF